ncbi:hypothetical protein OS190_11005 [Sulfitobacter sp. F26204]|uniref:hypothetical protein n=1 Tax=Sulfitobacter sp. F26204 TaxID=2996014 RepID=UPI00225E05B4|nr:hypothetical protein [Sulfitobacter sp. F26204]MCX7560097.1 hypothetical protein [Sulfitobacter sp. F26204]
MEYGRIEPIKGENGYEKTALTMKTIAELLAEEGTNADEIEAMKQSPMTRTPTPQPHLQQPPHMQSRAQMPEEADMPEKIMPKAATLPPITPVVETQEATKAPTKPRSFLKRLIGG